MKKVAISFVAASLFSVPDMLESAEAAYFQQQQATKPGGWGWGGPLIGYIKHKKACIKYLWNMLDDIIDIWQFVLQTVPETTVPLVISLSHPINVAFTGSCPNNGVVEEDGSVSQD